MAWVMLLVAGLLEIGWAVGFKYTNGFTRFWPTLSSAVALICSMTLLGLAVRILRWARPTPSGRASASSVQRFSASLSPNAMLVNYYRSTNRSDADDALWAQFVAASRQASNDHEPSRPSQRARPFSRASVSTLSWTQRTLKVRYAREPIMAFRLMQ